MSPYVQIKRVYDDPDKQDGLRVLVDRIWPRGLSKARLQYDLWPKDLAPSTELRTWFGHKPERWEDFKQKYLAELQSEQSQNLISEILLSAQNGTVTLLYGAKDTEHNQAVVLAAQMNAYIQRHPSG